MEIFVNPLFARWEETIQTKIFWKSSSSLKARVVSVISQKLALLIRTRSSTDRNVLTQTSILSVLHLPMDV